MTRSVHGWSLVGLVFAAACGDGPQPGATAGPAATASLARPKNVVFIVIDTLRADAMSLARTPNLRKLKAQGQSPALAWSKNSPVDSTTTSTPKAPQARVAGSFCALRWMTRPFTTN